MSREIPYSRAEREAGLDQLDQPWPAVKMERAMTGRADVPISAPRVVPMSQERPDVVGGELTVYVPATSTQHHPSPPVEPEQFHLTGEEVEEIRKLVKAEPDELTLTAVRRCVHPPTRATG